VENTIIALNVLALFCLVPAIVIALIGWAIVVVDLLYPPVDWVSARVNIPIATRMSLPAILVLVWFYYFCPHAEVLPEFHYVKTWF